MAFLFPKYIKQHDSNKYEYTIGKKKKKDKKKTLLLSKTQQAEKEGKEIDKITSLYSSQQIVKYYTLQIKKN